MQTHNLAGGKMFGAQSADESLERCAGVERFCHLWKRDVYAFCRAFLGDERAAEDATYEVLVAAYRRVCSSSLDKVPGAEIIAIAFQANRHREPLHPRASRGGSSLDRAILRLPVTERAVLIARNLLRMDLESVAHATGLSATQAHKC